MNASLPAIPAKRYFTIGEVADLCDVKTHVLRYWEQEFAQLRPLKRRGNRRYYQHHEVLMIRRIRDLLYVQGFTIVGARQQLASGLPDPVHLLQTGESQVQDTATAVTAVDLSQSQEPVQVPLTTAELKQALISIRNSLELE